jgi:DNA-binding transcriptional LysR family regulator
MQPMAWDDLQVFLAVARGGSHARAGKSLRVDATTIGRRMAALEGAFGARLFDRTPSGLVLTAAGRTLQPHAERVEAEMLAAERALAGADARVAGNVRVTASDGVVHYLLVPALPALGRAHPELSVELRADTRSLDLSRREADVAVRLGRPKEPALIARKLGTMRFALYASRAHLERSSPRSVEDLASHPFVGFGPDLDDVPQVRWLRRAVPSLRYSVRTNQTTTQVLACVEGGGIALLPTFVAAREPRLVPVLPRLETPVRDVFVVTHSELRKNARVAAVTAWLLEAGTALTS